MRRFILLLAAIVALIALILLLNFTAPNPTGRRYSSKAVERLHIIVGGGAQNAVLCQMTANAIGREVVAGPVEATALGNAVVQLIALGDLANMTEARALLSTHLDQTIYYPQESDQWENAFARFKSLFRADSNQVG